jgi:glycosyltransferase involved in cell wall biosynthesis
MVSIIIRAKNEERWITSCLQAVFSQDYKDLEVIIVDNKSTDKTIEKAKNFDVKIISIDEYYPGKALNTGIRASKGDHIVCLSAHCIPVNSRWLSNLLENLKDETIAAVYGRQEPMSFSSDFDKRDLMIVFGLDKRIQVKDSFFHNANSLIRRDVWEKTPFDEKITNIEDRVWAEEILKKGYKIAYEPGASVYHYHGIHQDGNPERCTNVVRILENLQVNNFDVSGNIIDIDELNAVAVIPVIGEPKYLDGRPLIEYTIRRALGSRYIKKVIVSTDNENMKAIAEELGAFVPFLRDPAYSSDYVDLEKVMQYTLDEIEKHGILSDLIVYMEPTFPFRPKPLIDDLIFQLVSKGLDTVMPAKEEFKSIWLEEGEGFKRIDEGFLPRKFKNPVYTGFKGLGCVTHPVFVREGKLFGNKVGMCKIANPYSFVEVRENEDFELAETLMRKWWSNEDAKKEVFGSGSSKKSV